MRRGVGRQRAGTRQGRVSPLEKSVASPRRCLFRGDGAILPFKVGRCGPPTLPDLSETDQFGWAMTEIQSSPNLSDPFSVRKRQNAKLRLGGRVRKVHSWTAGLGDHHDPPAGESVALPGEHLLAMCCRTAIPPAMNASDSVQLERLFDFLRFPSVSTDPERAEDVAACANWLASELRVCGLTTVIHPTAGHPIVVAKNRHQPGRRTVMIYGHYDVQPVDEPQREPGEALDGNKHWLTKPFDPVLKDGVIFARGSTDNKGQILAHITGIGETMSAAGDVPVNLIVLVEGEEEIGSANLESFLGEHAEELRCDIIAVSDTGMVARQTPTFTYGLRGIGALELRVFGPAMDLHSGIYGGAVLNPATVVARLVASLHDDRGRVAVPGFYEGVAELQSWERAAWSRLPLQDDELRRLTGVSALGGEEGFTSLERIWARPTAEVNGLGGGFGGKGTKTVIPREAFAKLTFRLVPDQDPAAVLETVSAHLRGICPEGVTLEILGGHAGEPYLMNPQSSDGQAAQRALQSAFPGREVALIREGGSIPIVNTFKRILGADTLLLGLALPDCRAHAPNENFPVENFFAGVRLNKALLEELARA